MDTRDRILQEALRLFAARGYEAVGVQEMVDAAGITKPSLYHHFGSKQGVLEALLDQQYGQLFEAIGPGLQYDGDLPFTLFRLARAQFDFAFSHREFFGMQHTMWFSAPDSVPHRTVVPHLQRLHGQLEELFKSAVRNHGNLRGHHTTYAITWMGMMNGYISSLQSVGMDHTDEIVHRAVKQFMYGIYAL